MRKRENRAKIGLAETEKTLSKILSRFKDTIKTGNFDMRGITIRSNVREEQVQEIFRLLVTKFENGIIDQTLTFRGQWFASYALSCATECLELDAKSWCSSHTCRTHTLRALQRCCHVTLPRHRHASTT